MGLITSSRNFWPEFSSRGKGDPLLVYPGLLDSATGFGISWPSCCLFRSRERPILASGGAIVQSGCLEWLPLVIAYLPAPTPPSSWRLGCLGLKGILFILGPVFHLASCQKSGLQASAGLGRWPGSPPICFPPFCVVINSFQPVVLDQFISAGAASAAGMMYGPQRRARLPMNHRSCSVSAPERAIRIRCNQLREGG